MSSRLALASLIFLIVWLIQELAFPHWLPYEQVQTWILLIGAALVFQIFSIFLTQFAGFWRQRSKKLAVAYLSAPLFICITATLAFYSRYPYYPWFCQAWPFWQWSMAFSALWILFLLSPAIYLLSKDLVDRLKFKRMLGFVAVLALLVLVVQRQEVQEFQPTFWVQTGDMDLLRELKIPTQRARDLPEARSCHPELRRLNREAFLFAPVLAPLTHNLFGTQICVALTATQAVQIGHDVLAGGGQILLVADDRESLRQLWKHYPQARWLPW